MLRFLSFAALLLGAVIVQAQEADAFLACADITDRVERVICLEEALAEATGEQQDNAAGAQPEQESAVEEFGDTGDSTAETPVAEAAEDSADREPRFRLPVIGKLFQRDGDDADADQEAAVAATESEAEGSVENFGRQARVVVNEDGEEELNDVVAELFLAKPNMWLIRLESGQVWRQTHPKRLNLQEGDPVRIYPTGWGDNFRLETSRLHGYIQVLRVE